MTHDATTMLPLIPLPVLPIIRISEVAQGASARFLSGLSRGPRDLG